MATGTVLSGPERRRRWSAAEKRRIVEESLAAEASVVEVARRHDIHPNLLHLWRRQARTRTVAPTGEPNDAPTQRVRFAPVAVATDARASTLPSGMIEIELASGTRLRITGSVDAAMVCAAVEAAARAERPR
jgi:transposase